MLEIILDIIIIGLLAWHIFMFYRHRSEHNQGNQEQKRDPYEKYRNQDGLLMGKKVE